MKLHICCVLVFLVLISGCAPTPKAFPTGTPSQPQMQNTPPPTQPAKALTTPTSAAQASDPGASSEEVNPLTGLPAPAGNLERRPVLVKIENLPRDNRPQWGLNAADLIFEYYTEQGSTRFAAIFYGEDAEKAAPIRSARFFDIQLIHMYNVVFVFGSAYKDLLVKLLESDFKDRLILEQPDSCPSLCRYDPNGRNILMVDTGLLQDYLASRGVNNDRPDLKGMSFSKDLPMGGDLASQVFVRFSGAIYNRWDYNAETGQYLRFSDTRNDINNTAPEYAPLTDRNTGEQIGVENLVILLTDYVPITLTKDSEVYDIPLSGSGWAYVFRDGQMYTADWVRARDDGVLQLKFPDGSAFPLKPGRTWFEVMNRSTQWKGDSGAWRFTFRLP